MVQTPNNPQTLNRYSYCNNNPVNHVDPSGHGWFKKFWKTFVGAVVGGLVTVLTGGAGAPLAAAMFWGGVAGGAVSGGLNGGWQGALMGAALGGITGFGVGSGISAFGQAFGYGALVAGAGASYAMGGTEGLAHFGVGILGGIVGSQIGNGILSYHHDGISNRNPLVGENAGKGPAENDNWRMLGIGTTDDAAQAAANRHGASVFYTKSRGILADFVRAGMQKVFGNSLASQQFASQHLQFASGVQIYAHSEGTLTLAGAIKHLNVDGVKLNDVHIKWNGPVITEALSQTLSNSIGATSEYHLNVFDPIGALRSPNPVDVGIYGGCGMATFTIFHRTSFYNH